MSWSSLQAIIDYAKDLAANPPPEVACPHCGEPLIKGHCNYDGYQSGDDALPGV
jgi:hypothetical protein